MSPEEELRFLILGAQREGSRRLGDQLAPLGVTPAQAEVVMCLKVGGAMSLVALGRLLVCETGSPSRLVDTLVGRNIVTRQQNPADRRQVQLALTREGIALATDIAQVEEQLYRTIRDQLDPAMIEALARPLRALVAGSPSGEAIARRKRGAASKPD